MELGTSTASSSGRARVSAPRWAQGEVRWAMAGRSMERLEAVRDACAAVNGVAKVRLLQQLAQYAVQPLWNRRA